MSLTRKPLLYLITCYPWFHHIWNYQLQSISDYPITRRNLSIFWILPVYRTSCTSTRRWLNSCLWWGKLSLSYLLHRVKSKRRVKHSFLSAIHFFSYAYNISYLGIDYLGIWNLSNVSRNPCWAQSIRSGILLAPIDLPLVSVPTLYWRIRPFLVRKKA